MQLHGSSVVRHRSGSPRLVSIQPLPTADGPMCEWAPASAGNSLAAALVQQQLLAAADEAPPDEATRLAASRRKPLRVIHDSYASYSAVAVDPAHDEVVLTDENLFNIMVYDRKANTPPAATMTESKRMIGGLNTKVEFQCGLYIDPASGDIYAVNNDTVNTLVIFSRQAKGDVPPDRELYTPHGTFGIGVDEAAQELYLTIQHDSAVVVYKKSAQKMDSPIRLLQGNRTGLADPHGLALDTRNRLMYVTNHGSVHQEDPNGESYVGQVRAQGRTNFPEGNAAPGTGKIYPPSISVHSMDAQGNTAPLRVIQGPKTQMNWPTGLAFDPNHNELYVANDMGSSILVFDAAASGDAAPVRVLAGPKTLLKYPTSVYVDLQNDEMWVANFGNHTATVYKRTAAGDTAPLRIIRSGPLGTEALDIGNPGALAYDSKREEILVPN
jgi:DNA-binding beta-propeller fold protein YncE